MHRYTLLEIRQCLLLSLIVLCVIWVPIANAEQIQWRKNKGMIVTIGSPYVEIYLFPGRGYPRFHVAEKFEKLRIFKSRAGWYKVETQDGKIGWVTNKSLYEVYDQDGKLVNFSPPPWGEADNPWQFGMLAGTLDKSIAYTLYTGYRFTPNISAELKYSQAFGDFSNVKLASGSLVHQPFPKWRVSPFFVWGAGALQTFPDAILVEAEDQVDSVITVGGGFMIYLAHNLVTRIEYNQHTILTTRESNEEVEEWKAGFSVLF